MNPLTPKEKAKALFDRYYSITGPFTEAKQCALLAVEEIEQALTDYGQTSYELQNMDREFNYWNEVKKELELL